MQDRTIKHTLPGDIERSSMAIICQELEQRGIVLPEENAAVVRRVIHTTADFDYVEHLRFTPDAVALGAAALGDGAPIVTDTNMALAGVSKSALERLGGKAYCFMADPEVAQAARNEGTTRAVVSMKKAAQAVPNGVFAIGNAPTALLSLCQEMERGYRPALVIAVPVGFVNVVESKERLWDCCHRWQVPAIVAMGRKGGSNVAAAICNALLYTAAGTLDPADRGWQG